MYLFVYKRSKDLNWEKPFIWIRFSTNTPDNQKYISSLLSPKNCLLALYVSVDIQLYDRDATIYAYSKTYGYLRKMDLSYGEKQAIGSLVEGYSRDVEIWEIIAEDQLPELPRDVFAQYYAKFNQNLDIDLGEWPDA